MPGLMLHQDGSRHLWLPALVRPIDLIVTMDDATSESYSMVLVEEKGTWLRCLSLREVILKLGLFCSLYTDRGSHYFHMPKPGEAVSKTVLTEVGRAWNGSASGTSPPIRPRRGPLGAYVRDPSRATGEGAGGCRDRRHRDGQPLHLRDLSEILCREDERVVDRDNMVTSAGRHFVRATLKDRRYVSGEIGLFYGPRCIGRYGPDGKPIRQASTAA